MELYIATAIFVLILVLFRDRSATFLSVYAAATMIYYFVAFTGSFYRYGGLLKPGTGPYNAWKISSSTYVVLIINLLILAIFLMCAREKYPYREKTELLGEIRAMKIVIVAVFVLGVVLCFKHQLFLLNKYDKGSLAAESGRIEAYFKYIASFVAVYVFAKDDLQLSLLYKIMTIAVMAFTFLFAERSYIVISICAVVFNKITKECHKHYRSLWQYFKKNLHVILLVIAFILITFLAKEVIVDILTSRWDRVVEKLSNLDIYKTSILYSEPNAITRNVDSIVSSNFHLDKSSYRALWAFVFPFITGKIQEDMGVESFAKVYQRELYPEGARNKASTYLGEAFANGDYAAVIVVVAMVLLFLLMVYKGYMKCSSNLTKTMFLLMGIDVAFYIHRNDMAYQFSRLRAYVYIYLMCYILICLISRRWKIRI